MLDFVGAEDILTTDRNFREKVVDPYRHFSDDAEENGYHQISFWLRRIALLRKDRITGNQMIPLLRSAENVSGVIPSSFRTSTVCSPNRGAGRRTWQGVELSLTGNPVIRTLPYPG